ncbi:SHOCT domain-containing protein [Arthrobacter sp. UYEF20]|uniref:SHOCT domain-containing protein n=1 Tax=Arthrobacter sp. UYEF20 TaxID=1756363 RepID=UPI003396008C
MTAAITGPAAAIATRGPWSDGGFSPWFLLFPLFWILVIGLLIFIGRRTWRSNRRWAAAQGGEGVLRERYARGEIDEDEYRKRLHVLRGGEKSAGK